MIRWHKYDFIVEDSSRLMRIFRTKLSAWQVALLFLIAAAIAVAAGAFLVMITPLHNLLPGYMKEDERQQYLEMQIRLDSLVHTAAVNQSYIDNLLNTFNPKNSVELSKSSSEANETRYPAEKLLSQSRKEKEFAMLMQRRTGNNLVSKESRTSSFPFLTSPARGGIISNESIDSLKPKILLPLGSYVESMAPGEVIAIYPIEGKPRSYEFIMQHDDGVIAIYGNLANLQAEKGEIISGNRPIGKPASGNFITLEIYHNGRRISPSPLFQH